MTAAEIQEQFTDAPCVTGLMQGQQEAIQTILLWKILYGDVPMTAADIQDLFSDAPCVTNLAPGQQQQLQTILLWLISGGGGGGGTVAGEGDNFCFSGVAPNQVLKIKNITTGLANRIDAVDTDPTVHLDLADGSAC